MKNDFRFSGGTLVIYANRKGRRIEILADASNFDLLNSVPISWTVFKTGRLYYARCQFSKGPRGNVQTTQILMHRFIMDAPPHLLVDHVNHNTLDNRRQNLRLATKSTNGLNLRSTNGRKDVKYRNVHWSSQMQRWRVRVVVNNVEHYFGAYADKDEARLVAIEARKRLGISDASASLASLRKT